MKRKLLTIVIYAFLFVILAASSAGIVRAASLDKASEPLDTDRDCSLTLVYRSDEEKYDRVTVDLFYVAALGSDLQFSLANGFDEYPIRVNGIRAQSEWDEIRTTIEMYIAADKITPDFSAVTDTDGRAPFSALKAGLYYFRHIDPPNEDVPDFSTGLVVVPGLDDGGKWTYDQTVYPKPAPKDHTYETMKVVKEWRDGGEDTNKRPDEIQADIYCDAEIYERVKLNRGNNWTYSWKTEGDHQWSVVETVVPEGYSVTTVLKDNVFFITNTDDGEYPPPQTGESTHVYAVIIILDLIGLFLLTAGIVKRRKHSDE